MKRHISVIPAKFSMTGSTPANNENPPSPPFCKGGLGGFESYFLTKPESSYAPLTLPLSPENGGEGGGEGEMSVILKFSILLLHFALEFSQLLKRLYACEDDFGPGSIISATGTGPLPGHSPAGFGRAPDSGKSLFRFPRASTPGPISSRSARPGGSVCRKNPA